MIGSSKIDWGKELIDLVYDRICDLDIEDISQLVKEDIDIGSVYRGLNKRIFFIKANDLRIKLYYIADDDDVRGFYLDYEFKQEDCYQTIFLYCFFIAGEFKFENPIKLYNGFVHTIRKYLESINIQTITLSEMKYMDSKLGGEGIPFGAIVLKDMPEIEFYRDLFGFDYFAFDLAKDQKYVYLLYNEKNGFFKIGYSKNPMKREKTLQAEEPDIAILKLWEKDMAFEKHLHKKYIKQRVRGEWFKFTFQELWELREL